jgi:glycosyltransferase involved in cell wall biosynthesis
VLNKTLYISVIIPVFNGSKFLPACLGAVYESTFTSFEVIVVNDCSTDDSAEISGKMGAAVISTSHRSGPGAARNLAAETARGDVLLFVDADVVVKPGTIAKVAARFEKDSGMSALFGSYDDEPAEQNFLSQYKNLQHHFVHQTSSPVASTFWSGLGAIRRNVFLALGGFDCKKFEVPSIEDIELGLRLRAAGHHIVLDRDIQAKHLKKWQVISLLRTDIFCRAEPWSKLIVQSRGMINDLNLKTSDRMSALLVGLCFGMFPLVFFETRLLFLVVFFLLTILFLNRRIFTFFAGKKGVWFAIKAFPWQLLYFFYSGVVFVFCWVIYALPFAIGFKKQDEFNGTSSID